MSAQDSISRNSSSANPGRDFYKILEVEPKASSETIRRAYRRKALECHPDRAGSSGDFLDVQCAYEVLSDEKKRKIFDTYGEPGISVLQSCGSLSILLDDKFSSMVWSATIVMQILLFQVMIFLIMCVFKIDNNTRVPWVNVTAPLLVLEILIFIPYVLTIRSNKEIKTKKDWRYILQVMQYIVFVAFQTLAALYLDKTVSLAVLACAWIVMETVSLAISFLEVNKIIKKQALIESEPGSTGQDLSYRPYTKWECFVIIADRYCHFLRIVQGILIFLKLSGDLTSSWSMIMMPFWLWIVFKVVSVILVANTPVLYSQGIQDKSSLKNFIVLVLVFPVFIAVFLYPSLYLLVKRLDSTDSTPKALKMLLPEIILVSLIIVLIFFLPLMCSATKKFLLNRYRKIIDTGSKEMAPSAGCLTASARASMSS